MNAILECILKYFSFLYDDYHCKFVDSEVFESFGDAFLTMRGNNILLRFYTDRGILFLDFKSTEINEKEESYSLDIIRQLITGEKEYYPTPDKDNAHFLQKHFYEIEEIFKPENFQKTKEEFHKLEQIRAKKLFG